MHSKINHFETACHPDTSGQPLSREEGELHALHFTDEVVLHATTGFSVADFSKDEQANLFQNAGQSLTCLLLLGMLELSVSSGISLQTISALSPIITV